LADLIVTNLAGQSELLTDYKNITRKRRVNGERSLSFFVMETPSNSHAIPLVCEESIVEYNGDKYRIKNIVERTIANTPVKDVTASHVFFDIVDTYQYDVLSSGTYSLAQVMNFIFTDTNSGWTFSIIDSFGTTTLEEDEEFGNDNALALFQKTLELFQAEFDLSGTDVRIRTKIGSTPEFQFRYKHNVKTLSKTVNTNDLSTFIKGYGKQTELKDIYDSAVNYDARTGTWTDLTEPNQYTQQKGATFMFNFTGTGCFFRHWSDNNGGIWEFVIDGSTDKKTTISTWNATQTTKVKEVVRNLENTLHTGKATFMGDDPKHTPVTGKNTSKGWACYSSSTGNKTMDVYRERVGDELFTCVAEYTSPMSTTYGIRHSPPVKSDTITNQAKLLTALQKAIIDKPEVTIELEFVELQNAGFAVTAPGLGDTVPTIYEPLNVDLDLRVLEIEDYPESTKSPKVSLSNVRQTFSDAQFSRTKAILDKIWDENSGKIRYNVYTEAVKKATEALNNSLTELEYPEGMGIIARDPNDASRFVALRSAGLGITTNGGETFDNAITADGVTTSLLTAGQIKTNNIQIIGNDDLFYWDGNALIAIDAADPNKYVRIKSGELYIKKGAMVIERADGYKVFNNGYLQTDYSVQPHYPPYFQAPVTPNGIWMSNNTLTHGAFCYFNLKHQSRYLKLGIYTRNDNAISTTSVRIRDAFTEEILAYGGSNSTDIAGLAETLTVDLGVPNGSRRAFYVDLRNTENNAVAYARILQIYMED
jgi:phage minor structural protein